MWQKLEFPMATVEAAAPSTSVDAPQSTVNSEPAHKLIRPSQLSIYDPCCCHHNTTASAQEEASSPLEEGVRNARIAVLESFGLLEGSRDRIVQFYETGKAHSLDTVAYLREDANLLARIGAISVGGLTGLLLGVRGGFFKKLIYGTISSSAVAAVCYPQKTSELSNGAFTIAKYYYFVGIKRIEEEIKTQVSSKKSDKEYVQSQKQKPTPLTANVTETVDAKVIPSKNVDFGQSNPKDEDMYTTRGK